LKAFDNTQIIEVDPHRELYTYYGLHMNQKGKEQMAKTIVLVVKWFLYKKINPIIMPENTSIEVLATDYGMETIPEHVNMKPHNSQKSTYSNVTSVTTRPHKPPNNMLKDFLC